MAGYEYEEEELLREMAEDEAAYLRSRFPYPGLFMVPGKRGCPSELSGRGDSTSNHASGPGGECGLLGNRIRRFRRPAGSQSVSLPSLSPRPTAAGCRRRLR
jgi:hypothetical protein